MIEIEKGYDLAGCYFIVGEMVVFYTIGIKQRWRGRGWGVGDYCNRFTDKNLMGR
jgi:hypothetical protein